MLMMMLFIYFFCVTNFSFYVVMKILCKFWITDQLKSIQASSVIVVGWIDDNECEVICMCFFSQMKSWLLR